MIDRKQNLKADEMNPETRVHASDQPSRQIGASGMDVAREGYSVLDRANSRSFFGPNRSGVPTARPVNDGAADSDEGTIYGGRISGVG